MKKLLLAASCAAMLSSAVPAFAAGPAPQWQAGDAARDGQEARRPDWRRPGMGEHRGMAGRGGVRRDPARMFDRIDANHDGSISRGEFMSARQRMMQRRQDRRQEGWRAGDRYAPSR